MPNATYPYDPTGEASTNLITNELHNVQPPANLNEASFIIPRAAPFFLTNLKIRKGPTETSELLLEGVHYKLTHHFVSASYLLGKSVYSSITWLNRNQSGNVYLTYQTIGGNFVLDSYTGVEQLTRQAYSIYSVTWEQVAGLIQGLPPYSHTMSGEDTTGYGELVDAVNLIAATIRDTTAGGGTTNSTIESRFQAHLDANISHTKAQVGLNRVENYPIATVAESKAGDANTKYMTPLGVKQAIVYNLEQMGITTNPAAIQTLNTQYSNLSNRVTGLSDNVNTNSANITELARRIDSANNEINSIKSSVTSLSNTTAQNLDELSRELIEVKGELEHLEQNLFFAETTVGEYNNRVTTLSNKVTSLETLVNSYQTKIDTLNTAVDKLDPTKNFVRVQTYLSGYHKLVIPPGCRAKITLVGAVTTGNTDVDTKMYEGSRFDANTNSYSPITPNINAPIATAPGAIAGLLTGRSPSQTLPNAIVKTGNPATILSSTPEAVQYQGGSGVIYNSITWGQGIDGTPTTASAGASSIETTLNNTSTSNLEYFVFVGSGKLNTTLPGLSKNSTGLCAVALSKIGE